MRTVPCVTVHPREPKSRAPWGAGHPRYQGTDNIRVEMHSKDRPFNPRVAMKL